MTEYFCFFFWIKNSHEDRKSSLNINQKRMGKFNPRSDKLTRKFVCYFPPKEPQKPSPTNYKIYKCDNNFSAKISVENSACVDQYSRAGQNNQDRNFVRHFFVCLCCVNAQLQLSESKFCHRTRGPVTVQCCCWRTLDNSNTVRGLHLLHESFAQ